MADTAADSDGLTEREHEILVCLAEGLSNQEVAQRLYLAENTVRWYNSQIYSKLGVNNRSSAIERAQILGLLGRPDVAAVESKHNLPGQATPFIGRQQELADLDRLIADAATRLVTILAPGGMGKTRLALAAAERQLRRFADGVFFVPLAPLTSPDLIVTTIAEQVGLSLYGAEALDQQLIDYLHDRNMLLVLDNFEHLLDGAGLVADLIQAAPQVRMLATSREKLNLSGETVFTLSGLHFPTWETPEDALQYDAVQLFMQSAQRVRSDFELQTEDLDFLARICRLTAGMPLALVLSAGWVDVLSLEQIAAEIQQGIDILETELRDVPERQRSVRASFNTSWARLNDSEREVFMKLSVFRGGFTAEAAQGVAGANARHLRKLVDKSLVQALAAHRYDIHGLLRQYGVVQLKAAGQGDPVRDAHSHYYGALFHARRSDQRGPGKADLLRLFTAEVDNVRTAWAWAVQHRHDDVIDQLVELLFMYFTDYSEAFEMGAMCQASVEVLAASSDQRERALLGRVLARQGKWAAASARFDQAETLFRQSMAIARDQGDLDEYYYALRWLARYVLLRQGTELDIVRQMLEECVAFYREQGDKANLAQSLTNLAGIWQRNGKIELMRVCLVENYQINCEMNYPHGTAEALWFLGGLASNEGAWAEAEQRLSEAMEINIQVGSRRGLMAEQPLLGRVVLMQGDLRRAEQLCEAALAVRQTIDHRTGWETYATISARLSQSLIADAHNASDEALELLQEARNLAQGRGELTGGELVESIHAWVLCSLGQFDAAYRHLAAQFRHSGKAPLLRSNLLFVTAVYARLLAHRSEYSRAVELLGLVYTHPNGPRGYLEQHQGMTRLCSQLEAELGDEAYADAWQRGQELDLQAVAAQLSAEFAGAGS